MLFLDPSGEGNGGESVWGLIEGPEKRFFEAEYQPKIRHSEPGLLSMVSLGDSLIGSQFFFTLGTDQTSLDGIHCVIGQVVEGLDVLREINEVICDNTHRPYKDVRITHTVILDDPFDNPRGFREVSRSPSPSAERLRGGRIAADEDIDETNGKTDVELAELRLEREAKARATILEIIGDLPDAEIAPPENVLFVCKLNSVTTDDDLEIIFSRFGKIKGCEIIRDRKSGDSLQYAFIEFEDKKSCEMAYFKMDNVLIDDRRIHVDFSQSVSKFQWRGKGKGFIMKDGSNSNHLDFDNYNKPLRGNNRGDNRENNRKPYRDGSQFGNKRNRSPRRNQIDDRKRQRSRSPYERRRSRSVENRRNRSPRRDQVDKRNDRRRSRSPYVKLRSRSAENKRNSSPRRNQMDDRRDRQRVRSRSPNDRRRSRSNDRTMSRRNYSPPNRNYRRDTRDSNINRNETERKNERSNRDSSVERRKIQRSPSVEKRNKDHHSEKKSNKKSKKSKHKKNKKQKKSKSSKKHKKHSSSESSSSDSDSSSSSSS